MLRKITLYVLFALLILTQLNTVWATTLEAKEKVVYLTFDDGPTPKVTEKILNILEKENVKATFFVVGKEIKQREEILKQIYQKGHGIGLHTYSHNFRQIYNTTNIFIEEMEKTEQVINHTLGTEMDIKVIRFPGGSAGRLNETFFRELEKKQYKIFDWNVNLQDGVNPGLSPYTLLQNAKKCRDKGDRRIILAHCNSKNINTCLALSDIIKYYKEQGYVFKIIDNDTEPYYYKFKKKS